MFNKFPYTIIILTVIFVICLIFAKIEKHNQQKRKSCLNDLFVESQKQQIQKFREKFKYDLIGEWSSFEGTISNMMNESWIFNSDGKGKIISRSVMLGESIQVFKWRRKNLYSIEISYFGDEKECNWTEVRYDFCLIPTDCGDIVSLVEVDEEKITHKGFGLAEVPLSYDGSFD